MPVSEATINGEIASTHVSKAFIIDDDPDVRRSISVLARSVDLEFELFSSAHEFLERCNAEIPGCIILDVRMPEMNGLELQRQLIDRGIRTPIIILTAYGDMPMVTQAMRRGAVDFLTKPYNPQKLLERIHEAINLDRSIRRVDARRASAVEHKALLTPRENEVMELLATANSSKAIAKRLGVSIKTVDNHRAKILDKMQVESVPELVLLYANHLGGSEECA